MNRFGATILDADGLTLSAEEKALFREVNPYGFILFARNIDTPDQVRGLCEDMRACVGRDAPILIDQEGGRVQRLVPPTWRGWTPSWDFVTTAGEQAEGAMYLRYRIIAAELRDLGIDTNCAPMVDVAGPDTHEFLKNRCYGDAPASVAQLGRAVADGLMDGGVIPVLKHIPGHGAATVDSHYGLPVVHDPIEVVSARDFEPFRALNDLPMGMTAHLVYAAIDDKPATVSPKMMRLIREDIGFENLIMTDDLGMKALSGSLSDLSRQSLDAGCDVILYCNGTLDQRREVAEAAGQLSFAGQTRALRALNARRTPQDIDIDALCAQLETLLSGQGHG